MDQMRADQELVDEVKRGDKVAFSELVKRHQSALLRTCTRMVKDEELAEDIVQETFVKVFRKIHLFEGRSSFKSWLYQIALNTGRNKLRSNRLEIVSMDHVQLSTKATAESTLVENDIREILKIEVARLPDRQRMALELRIYEDLSFQEIADIMNCPYDTAKANYRHGILKIKMALESNEVLKNWSSSGDTILTEINLQLAEGDA
jgi:RNA polymerase sigma-70 factor (ECF subfamily)